MQYDYVNGDETPKEPSILSFYDRDLDIYLQLNNRYIYTYYNIVNLDTGEVRIEF